MSRIPEKDRCEAQALLSREGETMVVEIRGDWLSLEKIPAAPRADLPASAERVLLNAEELGEWDSCLLVYLERLRRCCLERGLVLDYGNLPKGAASLLRLAKAVPEREAVLVGEEDSLRVKVGRAALCWAGGFLDMVGFSGEILLAVLRLLCGRAQCRWRDFFAVVYECGPRSFPIVSLVTFLVGLILAYVGAIQLRMFGAEIYVADLVGIGMVREMAAIMVGVVMAGRVGAAFAAELGSMQVNEEVDALQTMGISPVEFLVLPRFLALTLMMPLLCAYANLMSVLGGMFVGVFVLGLNSAEYYLETVDAVGINDFLIGIFMSIVFGQLVAFSGCLRGMRCGRSSEGVGRATTSSVVTSIVLITVATAVITILCDILGI